MLTLDITASLNAALKNGLTAINQYFLHARMLKHEGFLKLADAKYRESINAMKYADQLVDRILTLGGAPSLQELGALAIGEKVPDMLEADLALAERAHTALKAAITLCETKEDYVTSGLLEVIQHSEEEHMRFIRTQQGLISSLGLPAYLQTQV